MIIKALTVVAALAVVVQCICALNQMTLRTAHGVRVVYLSMLLSSAGSTLSPFYGVEPTIWDATLMTTVAAFLFVNKRRVYMVGPA